MFEPRHNIHSNVCMSVRKYVVTRLEHSRERNRRITFSAGLSIGTYFRDVSSARQTTSGPDFSLRFLCSSTTIISMGSTSHHNIRGRDHVRDCLENFNSSRNENRSFAAGELGEKGVKMLQAFSLLWGPDCG